MKTTIKLNTSGVPPRYSMSRYTSVSMCEVFNHAGDTRLRLTRNTIFGNVYLTGNKQRAK